MILNRELEIAKEAAVLAGETIMKIYNRDFSVGYKDDASPVTEADIAANQVIVSLLREHFPQDGILSEETLDDESRFKAHRFWNIDPLDGTKEFIKKNGEFSVNIALVMGNHVLLGVVYMPVEGMLYYAVSSQGAYKENCHTGNLQRIFVSDRMNALRLLVSRSHPSERTKELIERKKDSLESITEMGSAKKGCVIAEGLYDIYYNFGHSMKWDTCAVECIVAEAGGQLRRLDGTSIDYTERNNLNKGFYIVNRVENCLTKE